MKLVKFGDLPPGTIWRMPDDNGWWLKVDASNVYRDCHNADPEHKGWSIQISGHYARSFAGLLFWTRNDRDVVVWDGKEDLNDQDS